MYNAYQYIIANDGVTTASSYPFVAKVLYINTHPTSIALHSHPAITVWI